MRQLINSILSSTIIITLLTIFKVLLYFVFIKGDLSTSILIKFALAIGVGVLFGFLVWLIGLALVKLNNGIIFAFLYFFFGFPWPHQFGGVYHHWWDYLISGVIILLSGVLFSFMFNYLKNKNIKNAQK